VGRGEIHLSGIHRLKAHLTGENHRQVLAEAKHKTIKEIECLVARLCPQPDVPSRIRRLPTRSRAPAPAALGLGTTVQTGNGDANDGASGSPATTAPAAVSASVPGSAPLPTRPSPPPPRSPDPRPLSPRRYKLEVTLDEQAHDELVQLQGLMAHQVPDGDPAAIVTRALSLLLEQTLKKKAAVTERPRPSQRQASRSSRAIPAQIRREVWERDQGRCAFIGQDGRRCGETRQLEYAHAQPWAKGGGHSTSNIALRCRAHNAFEARRDYGEAFMASKRRGRPKDDCVREEVAAYVAAPRAAERTAKSPPSTTASAAGQAPPVQERATWPVELGRHLARRRPGLALPCLRRGAASAQDRAVQGASRKAPTGAAGHPRKLGARGGAPQRPAAAGRGQPTVHAAAPASHG